MATTIYLAWSIVLVALAGIAYLGLPQEQRNVILRRLQFPGRKSFVASTPDGSVSSKKETSKALADSAQDIASTFPPFSRDNLKKLAESLTPAQRHALGDLEFDEDRLADSLLGLEDDYQHAEPFKYTFSGFSVAEIKALGDFPDYSTLCDVPMPDAYHEFDIDRAKPRPYRPFRWAYHQTMSLTKMETDWWIELEDTYRTRIAQRKQLYEQHGEDVVQWLPGSELACKELMEMSIQFLCARYPQYFILSSDKQRLTNNILGTTSAIRDKHPLLVMLDHIPEDFALMLRDPKTGYYHFRAGIICSAMGWNVGSKIGLQLHQIHEPIPDYKEKMQFSMDRYFTKMPCSKPIQRGSWGLEVDQPLYMPPGHPHEKYRDVQSPELTLDRCHLRVDWQTLRRQPLSGAVVFNFKAIFTPVTEFRNEPYIPSLILKVLREAKENLMKYKGTWHTEHVIIPALVQFEQEQIQRGMIEKDWEPHTLDESPWFPGWEDKWHSQQGF